MAADWTAEESVFDLRQGQDICLFSALFKRALRSTQPPVQWVVVPGAFPLGGEVYHIRLAQRIRMHKDRDSQEYKQAKTIQLLLCFWTLSIVLFLFKHNVSETGFCLRLQVEPTQLDQIDRTSPLSGH
jgi:hypothetical protein